MESVSLVESGLSVSSQIQNVPVTIVDAAPLLLDVLHVELLAADQGVSLDKKMHFKWIQSNLKE